MFQFSNRTCNYSFSLLRRYLSTSVTLDINLISILRKETGASIQLCRQALEQANNDLNLAKSKVAILCQQRADKASTQSDDLMKEGLIGTFQYDNYVALVELRCKTDFAARSPTFAELFKSIADSIDSSSEAISNMAKTTSGVLQEPIKIQSTIKIPRLYPGQVIGTYLHNKTSTGLGTVGAVVRLDTSDVSTFGKLANQIACHIAGTNPQTIDNLNDEPFIFSEEGETIGEIIRKSGLGPIEFFQRCSIK